jgi:hypothetical protein
MYLFVLLSSKSKATNHQGVSISVNPIREVQDAGKRGSFAHLIRMLSTNHISFEIFLKSLASFAKIQVKRKHLIKHGPSQNRN